MIKKAMSLISAVASVAVVSTAAVTYEQHVYPIMKEHCLNCHNPDKTKGDLDLASYKALLAGSSSGEIVVAGNASRSALLSVITHEDEPEMPPKKPKIPAAEIDIIRQWIAGGIIETGRWRSQKIR